MKKTKVFRKFFVDLVLMAGITAGYAQSANSNTGTPPAGTDKQTFYKLHEQNKATLAGQEKTKQVNPATQSFNRLILRSASSTTNASVTPPVSISQSVDRKQLLLDLRAKAIASGKSTAKYDSELQQLNH